MSAEPKLRPNETNANRYYFYLALCLCLLLAAAWWRFPHPMLAPVIALFPIAIILVLSLPFEMVLLFVIFSFFRIHEVFPALYSLKIPLMLSLGSIVGLGWHLAITQKVKMWWNRELILISIFFMLVTVGVVMASNRGVAIEYFKGIYWKIALMTYAITWLTRTSRDFSLACTLLTVSGCLVSLVALSNKANGIGLVEETRVTIGRALGSVLGDPNDLALVLMFPAAFATSLMTTAKLARWQRWLGIFSVPILFFAVLATQSRGGLLGIIAVFGVFLYRKLNNRFLFIIIGLCAGLLLYVVAGISDRSSGGSAEDGMDASAQGRLFAWEAAWGMALHNPFTGVGIDNFYSNYFYYSAHWDGLNHAVHSTWFGILAETGIVGLLVFVTIIIMLMRMAFNSVISLEKMAHAPAVITATANAVFAGLLGTVVAGTFLTQGFTWPIYILAALILAVARWVDLAKK